jgi:hypothetical protein
MVWLGNKRTAFYIVNVDKIFAEYTPIERFFGETTSFGWFNLDEKDVKFSGYVKLLRDIFN